MLPRTSNIWFTVTSILVGIQGIFAQQTNATCLPSYAWANNSLQQSPCQVASYLESACNGGSYIIPALPDPSNQHYFGPTLSNANPCQCSSVVYSLMSACAACQGGDAGILTWSLWSFNCSYPSLASFPPVIPAGTAVPAWAYINVTAVGGIFNATAAEQDLGAPESTWVPVPQPTCTVSIPSSSSTSVATPTNVTHSSGRSTRSNAGAIAGGVVGGLAGLSIIVAGAIWFLRRRSKVQGVGLLEKNPLDSPATGQPSIEYSVSPVPSPQPNMRLYNPDDPSTFPQSPDPSTHYTTADISSLVVPTSPSRVGLNSSSSHPGGYTGVPEV